jgi:hypothetical protein
MIRHLIASAVVATGLTLTPAIASADPGHHGGYGGPPYDGYRPVHPHGGEYGHPHGGGYGHPHGGHYGHDHHHHHGHYGPAYGYRPVYPVPYRPVPVYPVPPQPVIVQPGFSFGFSVVR